MLKENLVKWLSITYCSYVKFKTNSFDLTGRQYFYFYLTKLLKEKLIIDKPKIKTFKQFLNLIIRKIFCKLYYIDLEYT